jgi:hypothetical protein
MTSRLFVAAVAISGLLASAGITTAADEAVPLTPEMAAKREMIQRQQDQRITHEKRKAAAEALKAERAKVYKAKQAAQQQDAGQQPDAAPAAPETK